MLWKVAPREKGLHTLGEHAEVAATTSTMNPNPNPNLNPKILHNIDNNNNPNIYRSNVNVGNLHGTLDNGCDSEWDSECFEKNGVKINSISGMDDEFNKKNLIFI